ncbi:MAG: sel1 repeat family protein [Gammaproteobacteria bacterium]|nr:sel1 repeat family protein [Gammaproteobacteria bacterium]
MLKRLLLILFLMPSMAIAGKSEAIAYMKSGQYEKAAAEFEILAAEGDTRAMVTIGQFYYSGKLGPVDYEKANHWWYRAYEAGNADALSNIGVLYRDGQGVEQNLEIAYNIFLIVHMRSLGGQNTQIRNNGNLRKTIARLDGDSIRKALCFTEEYVYRYIDAEGKSVAPMKPEEIRIKDKEWWLQGEITDFDCA